MALNIAAMSEALTLATKAGVNQALVYQAIRGQLAGGCPYSMQSADGDGPQLQRGFRTDLHIKDLANTLQFPRRRRATAAHQLRLWR
ncbi:NAD-binding protein [Escherichia coli]